jgi:hypothetical protein
MPRTPPAPSLLVSLVGACNQGPRGYGPAARQAPRRRAPRARRHASRDPGGTTPAPGPSDSSGPALELAAGGRPRLRAPPGRRRAVLGPRRQRRARRRQLPRQPAARHRPRPRRRRPSSRSAAQHSCARQRSEHVACWGSNASGQLGDGEGRPGAASARPVPVRGLSDAIQLRAGKQPHLRPAPRRHGAVLGRQPRGPARQRGAPDLGRAGAGRRPRQRRRGRGRHRPHLRAHQHRQGPVLGHRRRGPARRSEPAPSHPGPGPGPRRRDPPRGRR